MENLEANTKKKTRKKVAAKDGGEFAVDKNKERDELIEKYLPYATSLAAKIAKTLPASMDFDDILCNARLGLLEAAKRYDSKYNVEFRTFAYYRIKGAIYDGLRKTGWIPRSLYSKMKFEKAANEYLQANEHNQDSKYDFYKNEMKNNVNSVASIYVMSIDSVEDFEVEDQNAAEKIEHRAEFLKIKEVVCDAIESLPDKERKLIKMYYFQNKTLEEIGGLLDLSKSWTSRLHARGLEMLFKKVGQMNQGEFNA